MSEENGWKVWVLPWWSWLFMIGPELLLIAFLFRGEDPHDQLWLTSLIVALNLLAVVALIVSVATSTEKSGGQLLLKGVTLWATNVTAFGIAFWERDYRSRSPEFQFPQTDPTWRARFFDYFYVSFTNSIAFSPTDALPLSRKTKLLMMVESIISATAILFLAARAVNIFK